MKTTILILLIIFISGLSLLSLNSEVNSQEEITIPVKEGGYFTLKNISIGIPMGFGGIPESSCPYLRGDVVNNTSKNWNRAFFGLVLYDKNGNKIKQNNYSISNAYVICDETIILDDDLFKFLITDFKKGETKSIGYNGEGAMLNIKGGNAVISKYEISFLKSEYPAQYIFVMTKPSENKDIVFEDDFLRILFFISKKQISFHLNNKTSNPIKIDWNQVSYIDISSSSHNVIHSGIKYTDKEKPQKTTIIPPTANLQDIIFPSDYIDYISGWEERPLFPEAPKAQSYKGKIFSVFMPLEINGIIKNYLFTFKIEDIES